MKIPNRNTFNNDKENNGHCESNIGILHTFHDMNEMYHNEAGKPKLTEWFDSSVCVA
jgi:hypothetical protein